tara:strand:+ start:56 stop:685 length:630 start_codon:yes stop_codon:yes gene_type:complete
MIFQSVLNIFKWVKYSLYVYIASSFLLIIFYCLELNLYNNDGLVFYDGLVWNKEDHVWTALSDVIYVLFISRIILIITFLMWIHRAYSNLPILGKYSPKTTPGWAVGWWFIPFANLFKTFGVMKELYILTGEDGAKISTNILGLWWAFWIFSIFIYAIFNIRSITNLEDYLGNIAINLFVTIMEIIAGILFLKILTSITYSQEIKSTNI